MRDLTQRSSIQQHPATDVPHGLKSVDVGARFRPGETLDINQRKDIDVGTIGEKAGAMLLPVSSPANGQPLPLPASPPPSCNIPLWRHNAPAVNAVPSPVSDPTLGGPLTSTTTPGQSGGAFTLAAQPVVSSSGGGVVPDARFLARQAKAGNLVPVPRGVPGVLVRDMNEDGDALVFIPSTVVGEAGNAGEPNAGLATPVYDVSGGSASPGKRARLHSQLRVVRVPAGGPAPIVSGAHPVNALALEYGIPADGRPGRGLIKDGDNLAAMSHEHAGGPITIPSAHSEQHALNGKTVSAHIHTEALFKDDHGDGPLEFTKREPRLVPDTGIYTKVWMQWNPFVQHGWYGGQQTGRWQWIASVIVKPDRPDDGVPEDGGGPPPWKPEPVPEPIGGGGGGGPGGGLEPVPGGGLVGPRAADPSDPRTGLPGVYSDPIPGVFRQHPRVEPVPSSPKPVREWSTGSGHDLSAYAPLAMAGPALLGRPQLSGRHGVDYRRDLRNYTDAAQHELMTRAPTVARLESYVLGDQSYYPGDVSYTQHPCQGRYPGGTRPGGYSLLPPEIAIDRLRDVADGSVSAVESAITSEVTNGTASATDLHIAPGAGVLFGGVPGIVSGGARQRLGWLSYGSAGTRFSVGYDNTGAIDETAEDRITGRQRVRDEAGTSYSLVRPDQGDHTLLTTPDGEAKVEDGGSTLTVDDGSGQQVGLLADDGVLKLPELSSDPSGSPSSGHAWVWWNSTSNTLKCKDSGGTTRTIGP